MSRLPPEMISSVLRHAASVLITLAPLSAECAAPRIGPASDAAACQSAISSVERTAAVPPGLLPAIARTESGRVVPGAGLVPWPWTINVAGVGHFYESAPDAITAVQEFQAAGIQSIDVGCLQVNLMHHPNAFASLQQAFDPQANAAYAAKFLLALHAETNDWPRATAAYHSRTPGLAEQYGRRVMLAWPQAASYGWRDTGGSAALRPPPWLTIVDPYGVYTPEFARHVAQEAAARAQRGSHLNLPPGVTGPLGAMARRPQLQARKSVRVAQWEAPGAGPASRRP